MIQAFILAGIAAFILGCGAGAGVMYWAFGPDDDDG